MKKFLSMEKQVIVTVVIGLGIVVNLLLIPLSLRADLSFGHAYSLSTSTKKILKNIDDVVNIKFFASSDLPSRLLPLKNDVQDFLNEYKRESGGKVRVQILDPKKNQDAMTQAKELGVPELQFSQLENDKYAVSSSYFGLALSYGDKKEILPQVTAIESLEYNLTNAMYKMTGKEEVKIGMVGMEESLDPAQDQLQLLKRTLGQQFQIETLDVSSASGSVNIDPSFKTVFVFTGGGKIYGEEEVSKLTRYLDNKGKGIFFVDGISVQDSLTASPATHNLFPLLAKYGIKVSGDLVLSTAAEVINLGNESNPFVPVLYPFWVKTNNFQKDISYFSNINQLTYPWVSSLTLEKKNNISVKELVKSTKESWVQKDGFFLNPQEIPLPDEKNLKEFLISAEAEKKDGGRIVVISSSRFTLDRYLSQASNNLEFLLNVVNDLASGGVLSGIRQRAVNFYPLPPLSESQKDLFKYGNMLLLPLVFICYGGLRLWKRRSG